VVATKGKKICPERSNWPGMLAGISEELATFQSYNFKTPDLSLLIK
jgi:hypothetical protein